jgi:hypothetical protein
MDSRTSAIRDEAFASTGRLGEACVSKHLTSVTPSDGVVTHPSTHTLRCGNIKATIWHNVREKGPFFATTFSRPFKDQSGAWRNGTSFGLNDLEALLIVAREAKEWIAAKVFKR